MKGCHLGLIFRGENFEPVEVRVFQTSIYARSESFQDVINQSHYITDFFRKRGFVCLREKIEAMAYGAKRNSTIISGDCVKY